MATQQIAKDNFFNTSDGAWIYFEDHDGPGDPVVMLPGFMLTVELFRRVIDGVTRTNRLILVDWRGHGNSSKTPWGLTMKRCAQDMYELFEHLGLTDVHFVGTSMGSSIVMQYIEDYGSERLQSVGIVDSYLYPFSHADWNKHGLRGYNTDKLSQIIELATINHERVARDFASSCFPPELRTPVEDIELVIQQILKIPVWVAYPLYNDFLMRDYTETLRKVDVPLFIAGSRSPISPAGIEMAHHYRRLRGDRCHVAEFPDSGHLMFFSDPDPFVRSLGEFLEATKVAGR